MRCIGGNYYPDMFESYYYWRCFVGQGGYCSFQAGRQHFYANRGERKKVQGKNNGEEELVTLEYFFSLFIAIHRHSRYIWNLGFDPWSPPPFLGPYVRPRGIHDSRRLLLSSCPHKVCPPILGIENSSAAFPP